MSEAKEELDKTADIFKRTKISPKDFFSNFSFWRMKSDINILTPSKMVALDIFVEFEGNELPPPRSTKIPQPLDLDEANGMSVLHISFMLNHFIPQWSFQRRLGQFIIYSHFHQFGCGTCGKLS
jgi:hypothetical protein